MTPEQLQEASDLAADNAKKILDGDIYAGIPGAMTPEQKKTIDDMSQYDMCRMWRFSPTGNPLMQGQAGEYFSKVLKEKGGFTPEISKSLGWER